LSIVVYCLDTFEVWRDL